MRLQSDAGSAAPASLLPVVLPLAYPGRASGATQSRLHFALHRRSTTGNRLSEFRLLGASLGGVTRDPSCAGVTRALLLVVARPRPDSLATDCDACRGLDAAAPCDATDDRRAPARAPSRTGAQQRETTAQLWRGGAATAPQ